MDQMIKIKDCYAVLSSGKSGTSCFAKMLVDSRMPRGEASYDPPPKNKEKKDKGRKKKPKRIQTPKARKSKVHRGVDSKEENRAIRTFHDKILKDNKASWGTPIDPSKMKLLDEDYETFGKIIKEVQFFKDPRTILFIERWWERFPNLKGLGLFRHPYLTARTIDGRGKKRKNKGSKGEKLYIFYYKLLLKLHKEYEFPLIEFGGETYLEEFTSLCKDLKLTARTSHYRYGGKRSKAGKKGQKSPPNHWEIPDNKGFEDWSQEMEEIYQELKERKTYQ